MKLFDQQKQWIVMVILIVVMGFLGIYFPVSAPGAPQAPQATLVPDMFSRSGSIEVNQLRVKNNEDHTSLETHSRRRI